MPDAPSLTINRRLNAPRAKVYAAWTDPAQLTGWFGNPQIARAHAELDVREGGHFRITMVGQDAQELEVSGVYREVVPGERLVFTWAWGGTPERVSRVTVRLKDDGAGTLLTLLHEQFFDEEACQRHNQGWIAALDNLDRFIAQQEA